VTPFVEVAPYMNLTGENLLMHPLLVELGVETLTGHMVDRISKGRATGHRKIAPGTELSWEFDSVVLVTQRIADDQLYREVTADHDALEANGISAVYRIGDCMAPRMHVADAIFDGHRLAREIDSEDPAIPLPYIREQRVIGASDEEYDAIIRPSGVYSPSSRLTETVGG
jgi:dimethylamine/trimethylamine dehydrogenase